MTHIMVLSIMAFIIMTLCIMPHIMALSIMTFIIMTPYAEPLADENMTLLSLLRQA
jgi:hypothetical protein